MAAPKRTTIQRERDLVTVAELYLKGCTQQYIAGVVSEEYEDETLTRQQIGYDIKKLIKRWQKSQLVDIDQAKTSELAKINHLERTYWDAWERSCEDAETVTQKTKGVVQRRQDDDGAFVSERPAEATKTSKGQAGDPRFLTGVMTCIDRRCKILGIDAPKQLRQQTITVDMNEWTEEEIRHVADGGDPYEILIARAGRGRTT